MKRHWLVPGTFVTLFILWSPAYAARLQSWRFDINQNQLEINTEGAVQPQAQLYFNPTRLVIDLPGTTFGHPQLTQPVGEAIRAIRAGEVDQKTSRIVVELTDGYTLDPKQVKFVVTTASRWTVQLPTPEVEKVDKSRNVPSPFVSAASKNVYSVGTINATKPEISKVAGIPFGTTQIENLFATARPAYSCDICPTCAVSPNKATQPEWRSLCSARITTLSSTNTTVGFTERCSVVQEKDIVLPIGNHGGYGFAAKWCECYANTELW